MAETVTIDSIKDRRKVLFDNFCADVTLHGFKQVCQERGIRRILWHIIFLGAIVMCVLLFYGVTKDYYLYKTYVTTNIFDFENKDIDFPTITICNKIPLIRKGYERVRKLMNITEEEFEEFHLKYLSRYKVQSDDAADAKIFEVLHENNITNYMDALKLFEINQEDMFFNPVSKLFLKSVTDQDYPTCRYNYKYDCTVNETISWRESLCFQLNSYDRGKQSKKGYTSKDGKYGNIISVLNIGTTSRFPKTHEVRESAPYMDLIEGIVLYMHRYGTPHYNPEFIKRIFLRPGMWHFLKIDYAEQIDLPAPYPAECGERKYKMLKHSDYPYSKSMCLVDCLLEKKMQECGCVGEEFKALVDLPICNITRMHCFAYSKGPLLRQCHNRDECPIECIQHKYNVILEQQDIRTDSVTDRTLKLPGWKLNRSETERYVSKNIIGLQIEYTSNAKIESVVPSVTLSTLIGTIGGSIGLAMGFSILTLFEFVFFVYDYVGFTINLRKRNLIEAARVKAIQVMNVLENSTSDTKESKDEDKDIPVLKIEETEIIKRDSVVSKVLTADQDSNNNDNNHHHTNEVFSIT